MPLPGPRDENGYARVVDMGVKPGEDSTLGARYTADIGYQYETVAASQTNQVMGATGAVGDYLKGVLVLPTTPAVGAVTVVDGANTINLLSSGTLADIAPFFVPLGLISVSSAWKITTGAALSVVGIGKFT